MPGYYLTENWISPLTGFPAYLLDPPKLPKTTPTSPTHNVASPTTVNLPRSSRSSTSEGSLPTTPRTPINSYWPTVPVSPETEERERLHLLLPSPMSSRFESGSASADGGHTPDNAYHSLHLRQSVPTLPKVSTKGQSGTPTKTSSKSASNAPPATVSEDQSSPSAQEFLIAKLEDHFNAPTFKLPVSQGSKQRSELTERELMWLSRECFIRFLSATKDNYLASISRMERALVWRRTNRFDDVEQVAKEIDREVRTGKHVAFGFTPQNWPILYSFCNRNTTPWDEDRAWSHMFMVERTIDLMADGVTKMVIIFTFYGEKLRPGPPWPVSTFRGLVEPFYEFYPDVLGVAVVQELPWWARLFVNLVWPFVPNRLRKFTRFLTYEETPQQPEMSHEQLLTECGGDLDLPWDYDTYWPIFLKTVLLRREEHLRLWREIGPPRAGYEEKRWKVALPSAIKVKADLGLLDTY